MGKVDLCPFVPFRTRTGPLVYAVESLRIRRVASMAYSSSLSDVTDAVRQLCKTFPRLLLLEVSVKAFTAVHHRSRKHSGYHASFHVFSTLLF